MNHPVKNKGLLDKIFAARQEDFNNISIEVFRFQYEHNKVYRQYCDTLKTAPAGVEEISQIPFLPISFFKTHTIKTMEFDAEAIFESSGTTQTINSKHFIKELSVYKESFLKAFDLFYGDPGNLCIIGLLPSYLERKNSSLVLMVDELIKRSHHPQSGFYLDDFDKLSKTLLQLEGRQQPTLLIGVTFALLDFAEKFPMHLKHTLIMETGGMKGRKKEITRLQVHEILSNAFNSYHIHSEYGMTELLSQAYSKANGLFNCPPWMKVLIREEDDPLTIYTAQPGKTISGAINVIDLANIYSCSFIATEDAGKLYPHENFEVLGRLDNTDIRGCSLLAL
ncbi:MAG: acyl transferase [Ferruginibacter sp.]